MIYIIILLSIALVVLFLIVISKGKNYDIFAEISPGEIENNAKNLAIAMRMPEAVGASPKTGYILKSLRSAYKIIMNKVENNEDLYEFEKWLYENYFVIANNFSQQSYRKFALLPHKDKRVRVLIVANFIVQATKGNVTREVIEQVNNIFNSHTPLHTEEIFSLKEAILFSLTDKIAVICKQVRHLNKMKLAAVRDKYINDKYSADDCYLYWFRRSGKEIKIKDIDTKSDINIDNLEYSFSTVLIDNAIIIGNCVASIKSMKSIFTTQELLNLSYSNNLMSSDEIYRIMDNDSKIEYLNAVERLSGLFNKPEKLVIDAAIALGKEHGTHFGSYFYEHKILLRAYLFNKKTKKIKVKTTKGLERTLAALIYLTTVVISFAFGLFAQNIATLVCLIIFGLFAFLPTAEYLIQRAHKLILVKRPIIKFNYTELPVNLSTLVVVPYYIASKEDITEAISNIKILRQGNKGSNITFAILLDYPKAKDITVADDFKWNNLIDEELKDCYDVNCFVRRRKKIGNSYGGYERKRGAISALNEMLLTKDYSEFSHVAHKDFKRPEYIIVLDADSKMLPGGVISAVNTIAHPLNSNYDLMTFGNKYNMFSFKSIYSKRYYFDSGFEGYNKYSDYYYNVCRKSVFCGKGIYRLSSFYDKLKDILPDGKVLSHDIIEGAIVNTGILNEAIFEDAPANMMAEQARRNRWLAGDIQLSTMIGNKIKNSHGRYNKVDKSPIYNYVMFSNMLKGLAPIAMMAMLLIGLFTMNIFATIPFIIVVGLRPLLQMLETVGGFHHSIRARYVFRQIISIIIDTVLTVILLPITAINNLVVFAKSIFKLAFSKSKELKWKTFAQTQDDSSFKSYVIMLIPSYIFITIVAIFAMSNMAVLGYCAIFIAISFACYGFNIPYDKSYKPTSHEEQELMNFARKTYNFFAVNRSDNCLICDNLQTNPYRGRSSNSSPTNFGMSILAEVSAAELGLVDCATAAENIFGIVKSINSLKKYRGHLYNWYNIDTKQILPPYYISSVDSANFVACLIVAKEFLHAHGLPYEDICLKLIDAHDFDFLLDKSKQLYYIGYDTKTKEYSAHYDLLASEARILNYIACAMSGSSTVWSRLNREVTRAYGNTLLSWSGTMFEYLMPCLFMRGGNNSLLENSNINAVKVQKKHKCNGLFGISESGYYKFDDNLNYQYFAFGESDLALRTSNNRCIISPYSSALALAYDPESAISNMRSLVKENMLGEYGFYESVDFTNGKHIIYSYMAHHQGMTVAAICNCLKDNILVKYFMSNITMKSAKMLLCERKNIHIAKGKERNDYKYDSIGNCNEYELKRSPELNPSVALLSNGKYHCILDDCGNGYSAINDILITRYRKNDSISQGVMSYFTDRRSGEKFSCSLSPMKNYTTFDKNEYRSIFTPSQASYININHNVKCEVFIPHCINGEIRQFSVYNTDNTTRSLSFNMYMEEVLSNYDADIAHPAFNDMFIETNYDPSTQTVVALRKAREKDGEQYIVISLIDAKISNITTNKYNAVGRLGDIRDLKFASTDDTKLNDFGAILYPCYAVQAELDIPAQCRKEFSIVIAYAENRCEIDNIIKEIHTSNFVGYAKSSAQVLSLSVAGKYIASEREYDFAMQLAARTLYAPYDITTLREIASVDMIAEYSRYGLDGKVKTLLYEYVNSDDCRTLAKSVAYINACGIRLNLIISYKEADIYHNATYNKILKDLTLTIPRIKLIENTSLSETLINTVFMRINDISTHFNTVAHESPIYEVHNNELIESDIFYPKIDKPSIDYESGSGGFNDKGEYIICSTPYMPYSNVVCDVKGGFIATDNGGGYSYFGNSREDKISEWNNNPIIDAPTEAIYICVNKQTERLIRLNKLQPNGYIMHGLGYTEFINNLFNLSVKLKLNSIKDGEIKVYELDVANISDKSCEFDITFMLSPSMGWAPNDDYLVSERLTNKLIKFSNALTKQHCFISATSEFEMLSNKYTAKLRLRDNGINSLFDNEIEGIIVGCKMRFKLVGGARTKQFIYLSPYNELLSELNNSAVYNETEISIRKFNNLNPISIKTDNKALNILFNKYLMYQVVSSRLNGRTGYYQCGGAIGFRDQLQDCLAYLYRDTAYVREHIIDAAAHQFIEGDVLHWWHPPYLGVRTRISDDKLFLPYAVSEYIRYTQDYDILNVEIPFVEGAELADGQESRYDNYRESKIKKTLSEHCKLAINSALQFGEDNLLLIGSGDWNDALNDIGMDGKGESVWLTMFAYQVISEFIGLILPIEKLEYLKVMDKMYQAVNKQFVGGWYRRAKTDNGVWIGDNSSKCCKIDLISQAFAVISGCGKPKENKQAIANAEEMLVDVDKRIIKLLTPPFNKTFYCGYISSYPEGVRENGGQYTHAAVWFIKAKAMLEDRESAVELINLINPIIKCSDIEMNKIYKAEPYVLTGDVYMTGQGGWSWYSGSAAWLYKVIVENIFGINIRGNYIYIDPQYIKSIGKEYSIAISNNGITYNLNFKQTNKRTLSIDNVFINKCDSRSQLLELPLYTAKEMYQIEITY